jgi:PEP-CTERM motif
MKRLALMSLLSAACPSAFATLMVQELFDGLALDTTINGQGDSGASSGFQSGSTWTVNAGATILTANNFNVESAPPLPGLSPQAAALGGLWKGGAGDWNTGYWATRPLAAAAQFNFDDSNTYYFSFRLNNTGDTGVGFGISSGNSAASTFFGVGGHWDNHLDILGADAKNALYLTGGVLGQNLPGNNDGPYASLLHAAPGTLNGRALIVGRLITGPGVDQIDLIQYNPGDVIHDNVNTIPWSLSTTQSVTGPASHALIWMNGSGNGELDALRFGTEWVDVTGVVAVPEPASVALLCAGLLLLRRRRLSRAA